ncbi:MAG: quinolinate synthase NadA [Anaerolineae bacterium]|nr:quinolinate synthase NadA [Anaerolineae bacterium]
MVQENQNPYTAKSGTETQEQEQIAVERIRQARPKLGEQVVILGHHYQRDAVIQFADFQGDSYKLCQEAAKGAAQYIVFAGVHFMAESAVILGRPDQTVILPSLEAGCPLADMANLAQVETAWQEIETALGSDPVEHVMPITYVNSTAELKAFVGRHGGTVCTSSNARNALTWAFTQREKVFFFPDQHLGRNTGKAMNIPLDEMILWDPFKPQGGLTTTDIQQARIILWDGYCSVHQGFLPSHIDEWRNKHPDSNIIVHPECNMNVVDRADYVGSTEFIIKTIEAAPSGSKWAVGTEIQLVNRLGKRHTDKLVVSLSPITCRCDTMYRITTTALADVLEGLVAGTVINPITVPDDIQRHAKVALDRMLTIPS